MSSKKSFMNVRPTRRTLVGVGLVAVLLLALVSVSFAAPPSAERRDRRQPVRPGRPAAPMGKSTLGDYVWHDANADGLQDVGEVGINGVIVNLYLDTGDEVPQPGEFVTSMTHRRRSEHRGHPDRLV